MKSWNSKQTIRKMQLIKCFIDKKSLLHCKKSLLMKRAALELC